MAGALGRKDSKAVEALLSQGANVDTIMESGMTIREALAAMGWGHLLEAMKPMPEGDKN